MPTKSVAELKTYLIMIEVQAKLQGVTS